MNYEIVWDIVAYRRLEQIWASAKPIGPAVDAFDQIERDLSEKPDEQGESRPNSRRIHFEAPLGIIYRVHARLREVHILDVWMFKTRKGT